jgi:hypothetical protein
MEKEYGELTGEQFRKLVTALPELRKQQTDLRELVAKVPKTRIDQLLVANYNWSIWYELSFFEHLAVVVDAFGKVDYLKMVLELPDPQQKLIDDIHLDIDCDSNPSTDIPNPRYEMQTLIGLAFSLQRTILSIMLFQQTLSGLVQQVREDDNIDALFNVVRIDRAAVACPPIADRIARAEICNDKRFFIRLRNALKGPQKKHWAGYCDLRYSLFALRELGFDKLSDDQLEKLLVHTLKVYPDNAGARKNLRRQYQLSKKIKTI